MNGLRCAVIGVGAVGSRTTHHLLAKGCRDFILVDPDIVRERNIDEHFAVRDMGRQKVDVLREQLLSKDPRVSVRAHPTYLTGMNTALVDCDLILDGTDNLETRFLLNELAHSEGIPCVFCAVGDAHALLFLMDGSPCYACFMGTTSAAGCEMPSALAARAAERQTDLAAEFLAGGAASELVRIGTTEERFPVHARSDCQVCTKRYRRLGRQALTVCRSQRVCKVFTETGAASFRELLVEDIPVQVTPGGLEIGTTDVDRARRIAERVLTKS